MSRCSHAVVGAIAACLVHAVSTGCAGSPTTSAEGVDASVVSFRRAYRTGASCHGRERGETVLRDATSWRTWFDATGCGRVLERPVADFSREMVVAVRDVTGPNGCYGVRIAGVVRSAARGYRVTVDRHVPTGDQVCTMQVVQPADSVVVPRAPGPVSFEWRTQRGPLPVND